MIRYSVAKTDEDLKQILALQQKNLPVSLEPEEIASQGFVTIRHELPLLKAMNSPHPHIVAKDGQKIIGYALVMERGFEKDIPLLGPMFREINAIPYSGGFLASVNYFIMGQICIDKPYRGQGVFDGLYQTMKEKLAGSFPMVITEVSTKNQRSLLAHLRVGFKNIKEYGHSDYSNWVILAWDWS